MTYKLVFSERSAKEINNLDNSTKLILKKWLNKHLSNCNNPRAFGKSLSGNKNGLWRYRIGNYRLICDIQDQQLIILALTFGHRSNVYDEN